MPANDLEFAIRVREHGRRIPRERFRVWHQLVSLEALRRIVLRSPVRTGRFRGNWQLAIGVVPSGERLSGDPVGEGAAVLEGLEGFTVVWIVNNLPYAVPLEEGHSPQAPEGVVMVTVVDLQGLQPSAAFINA